jgi:hypothetical protein
VIVEILGALAAFYAYKKFVNKSWMNFIKP